MQSNTFNASQHEQIKFYLLQSKSISVILQCCKSQFIKPAGIELSIKISPLTYIKKSAIYPKLLFLFIMNQKHEPDPNPEVGGDRFISLSCSSCSDSVISNLLSSKNQQNILFQ